MTPADAEARCLAAKLTVRAVDAVGRQIKVTVAKVPSSASGLAELTKRLGVSVTVSWGDGTGNVELWFMQREAT